ncbi:MAG TPA: phage baseplate assembly protein V, partial [Myxococcota bacterium]|nr:phage baseplate assembly protein V [Myxococcota bacterium]
MTDLIPILRALIRDELQNLKLGEIGVVTAIFPHAKGDTHNYECSLKLRDGDLELRKVPMCTPHIGMSSTPRIGDLVLVTYINGDTNNPVVIGRLYSDTSPPPDHEEKAWHVQSPYQDQTHMTLAADGAVKLAAGKTTLTMKKDGIIEINGEAALEIKVSGDATVS